MRGLKGLQERLQNAILREVLKNESTEFVFLFVWRIARLASYSGPDAFRMIRRRAQF